MWHSIKEISVEIKKNVGHVDVHHKKPELQGRCLNQIPELATWVLKTSRYGGVDTEAT